MLRTRVGYAGGASPDPTYRRIGDHTETLQVDFDPRVISYEDLLAEFFASHNACATPYSTQYMSAIFTDGAEQARMAEAAAARAASDRGSVVRTRIEPLRRFYLAEDYHQKYRLRARKDLTAEFEAIYPELRAFVDSTAVTRVNGYLAGHGTRQAFEAELPRLGLTPAAQEGLRAVCRGLR